MRECNWHILTCFWLLVLAVGAVHVVDGDSSYTPTGNVVGLVSLLVIELLNKIRGIIYDVNRMLTELTLAHVAHPGCLDKILRAVKWLCACVCVCVCVCVCATENKMW